MAATSRLPFNNGIKTALTTVEPSQKGGQKARLHRKPNLALREALKANHYQQKFRHVTLPLMMPGVVAGAALAFTASIDDFVISFFHRWSWRHHTPDLDLLLRQTQHHARH
jgi:hypothetical protein